MKQKLNLTITIDASASTLQAIKSISVKNDEINPSLAEELSDFITTQLEQAGIDEDFELTSAKGKISSKPSYTPGGLSSRVWLEQQKFKGKFHYSPPPHLGVAFGD